MRTLRIWNASSWAGMSRRCSCRPDDTVSIRDFRSTSVFPVDDDVRWLRERMCQIANVSLSQLEPTKVSSYTQGQYFAKHTDASFIQEKLWAFSARLAGVDDEGVQDPCAWPSRFCVRVGRNPSRAFRLERVKQLRSARVNSPFSQTLFLYLNDVPEGGRTNFFWLDGSDSIPGAGIFTQCIGELCSAGDRSGTEARCGSQDQRLSFAPKAGTAVIHFPTTTLEFGCVPDPRTMHESEEAVDTKHIVQQFIWPVAIDDHSPSADVQHEDVRREWDALFRLARG